VDETDVAVAVWAEVAALRRLTPKESVISKGILES